MELLVLSWASLAFRSSEPFSLGEGGPTQRAPSPGCRVHLRLTAQTAANQPAADLSAQVLRELTQLRSSWAPASPDFSGWNWVAVRGPFSTAATNRSPPCSAQVTSGARVRPRISSVHSRTA